MTLHQIREYLIPLEPERDERFRAEIERLGRRALRIIGLIEIFMPVTGAAIYYVFFNRPYGFHGLSVVFAVLLGIATYASAGTGWGSRYARLAALVSGILSSTVAIWSVMHLVSEGVASTVTGGTNILIVLLVGVAILPMKPWHALALGGASFLVYVYSVRAALRIGWVGQENVIQEEMVGLPLMVLLCVALAGASYQRLYESHRSHQLALQASGELRRAERRTLIAESAASMGRLAAAVSHELNSPVGAVRSAAGSLSLMLPRFLAAAGDERRRLAGLMEQVAGAIAESANRMEETVARMQRFVNLDRAEVQSVNLNQLVDDVLAFVRARAPGQVSFQTDAGELAPFPCRPQHVSAVLSSLLHHAAERAGEGGEAGVRTRRAGPCVEIAVWDSGPVLSPLDVSRLFDPEFREHHGRVTTGDWNLFTARRLARENGGDILVSSKPGKRTTFVVSLPCPGDAS